MNIKVGIGVIAGLLFVVLWGVGCGRSLSSQRPENSLVPVPGVTATPIRAQSETTVPAPSPAPADPLARSPNLPVTPTPSSQSPAGAPNQIDLIPQGQFGRSHAANNVTIEAALQGKWLTGSKQMAFKVVMDTHSVDLDVYDLGVLAILRDSQGREFKPVSWKAPKGGHHREGVLTFSADQPILTPDTIVVELSIRDIANASHLLRWDLRPAAS